MSRSDPGELQPVPPPPDAVPQDTGRPVPWSWLDALLVALITLLLAPFVSALLQMVFPEPTGSALAFPVLLALLAALTLAYVQVRYPGHLPALLGPRAFRWTDVAVGAGHGVVGFLVINLGFALIVSLLASLIGADMPTVQESIRERATDRESAPFVLVSIVLVAPLAEELFFRGMLFQGLRKYVGVWPGIGISAVLFGLAHYEQGNPEGSLYAFLVLFAVGMYLAWVFDRRGNLAAAMVMHATFNVIAAAGILAGLA